MGSAEERILQALHEKQRELGLGTSAFARWLGVSRPLWILTRDGQRFLGPRLAVAAAVKIPELEASVLIFLRHELPTRKSGVPVGKIGV